MNLFKTLQIAIPCTMGATIVVVPSVVAATYHNEEKPIPPEPIVIDPLYFENDDEKALGSSTIKYKLFNLDIATIDFEYKYDNGEWTDWTLDATSETDSKTLTIVSGQKLYVRNNSDTLSRDRDSKYLSFVMTGAIKAFGNTNCLINKQTIVPDHSFEHLFEGCASLTKAPDLPSDEVGTRSYRSMFKDCTQLTKTPELPATKLSFGSYANMFYGCTNLVETSDLVAKELPGECYFSMFYNCTSLVSTPVILGRELLGSGSNCFDMFNKCTSLKSIRWSSIPNSNLKSNCYLRMFAECKNLNVSQDSGQNLIFKYTEDDVDPLEDMFKNTGGTFKGTPVSGHSYYWNE